MSRLQRNDVFKQYKRLHQEDLLRQQQEARQESDQLLESQEDGSAAAQQVWDGYERESQDASVSWPKEVVHDVDEFHSIGGDRVAQKDSPLASSSGGRAAVPPAVARASAGGRRPAPRQADDVGRGAAQDQRASPPSQAVAAGGSAALEPRGSGRASPATSATLVSPYTPATAAAHVTPYPPEADEEDEFPDLDGAPVLPSTAAAEAYVSPAEVARKQRQLEEAQVVAERVSSSTSSSSLADQDEADSVPDSAQPPASGSSPPGRPGAAVVMDGDAEETSDGQEATAPREPSSTAREGPDAQPGNSTVERRHTPADPALNNTLNISITSGDDHTTSGTHLRQQLRESPGVLNASVNFGNPANLGDSFKSVSVSALTTTLNEVSRHRLRQGKTDGLSELDPLSPISCASNQVDPARAPVASPTGTPAVPAKTPRSVLEALKAGRTREGEDGADDEDWVNATSPGPLRHGARRDAEITFWPAILALNRDESLWRRYAKTASASATSRPAAKPKKHSFGFMSCCGGSSAKESASNVADDLGVVSSSSVPDSSFVAALKAMPLDHSNAVEESVLRAVYAGAIKLSRAVDGLEEEGGGRVSYERVGFQGSDPATDLRASGMLGLLATLYLIDYYPLFSRKLWRMCNPSTAGGSEAQSTARTAASSNDLPFVLLCFNFLGVVGELLQQHGEERFVTNSDVNRHSCVAVNRVGGGTNDEVILSADRSFAVVSHMRAWNDVSGEGGTESTAEAVFRQFPLLHAVCESLVGTLEIFYEDWICLTASRKPALPSIADFGSEMGKVRDLLIKRRGNGAPVGGLGLVMRAAMEARSAQQLGRAEAAAAAKGSSQ